MVFVTDLSTHSYLNTKDITFLDQSLHHGAISRTFKLYSVRARRARLLTLRDLDTSPLQQRPLVDASDRTEFEKNGENGVSLRKLYTESDYNTQIFEQAYYPVTEPAQSQPRTPLRYGIYNRLFGKFIRRQGIWLRSYQKDIISRYNFHNI